MGSNPTPSANIKENAMFDELEDFMSGLTDFMQAELQKVKELAKKDQPESNYSLEEMIELYEKYLPSESPGSPSRIATMTAQQRIKLAEQTRDMFTNGIELGYADGTVETVYPTDPLTGKRIT